MLTDSSVPFVRALLALATAASVARAATDAAYSYDYAKVTGPQYWAQLDVPDNQCGGSSNSPINVVRTSECDMVEDYTLVPGDCKLADFTFETVNNGLKATWPTSCERSTMNIPGIDGTYEALQLHIHILSEHTIDNELFDFELHIVHQLVNGTGIGENGGRNEFAVYGFILQVDEGFGFRENRQFQTLLNRWRANQWEQMVACDQTRLGGPMTNQFMNLVGKAVSRDIGVDIYGLVPKKNFYHYSGGLTTPPCSEVVWWNLADEPVKISPWQGKLMTSIVLEYMEECAVGKTLADPVDGSTARPPVPVGDRSVFRYCSMA